MTQTRTADAPLAVRGERKEPWRDAEWQELWLSMQSKAWTSLAIVPAGVGAPADFALTIAVTLARIGILHLGTPVHVADATKLPLVRLTPFMDEVRRLTEDDEPVLVALAPYQENPVTIAVAQSTDAAMLCVMLEHMSQTQAKASIDRIGQGRFLGSAVFRPDGSVVTGQGSSAPRPGR